MPSGKFFFVTGEVGHKKATLPIEVEAFFRQEAVQFASSLGVPPPAAE